MAWKGCKTLDEYYEYPRDSGKLSKREIVAMSKLWSIHEIAKFDGTSYTNVRRIIMRALRLERSKTQG